MFTRQKLILLFSILTTWYLARSENLLLRSWWLTFFVIELPLCFTSLFYRTIIYPRFVSPLRHLPSPKGGSFLHGQFPRINAETTGLPHREWLNEIPNGGLIRYTSLFGIERVLVTSPEAHREVLSQKSYEYVKPPAMMGPLTRLLGRGVLVVDGDEHRVQRKNLMPAFAFRHVKDLYPVFWSKTRDLVNELDKHLLTQKSPRTPVNISLWCNRVTLDIIGLAGIGQSFNAITDPDGKLASCYRDIFNLGPPNMALAVIASILPPSLLMNIPTKRNKKVNAASKFLRDYCSELVADKRKIMAEGKQNGVDILSVAIESGGFSNDDLVNQMMTFLAAGHETTSTAMTWTLLFLCQHPHIQTRLRKELRAGGLPSVRDATSDVTPAVLDRIPYLHAVCNESLRWKPPVPMTMRQSQADGVVCGQVIPAKAIIILVPMAVNFDRASWGPDADEFNPDRWMRDGCANTGGAESNYAFLSFLHGPRSCIGQGFAKAEFAALLAGLVSAYEFELVDPAREIETSTGVVQRVKGGLGVFVKPVEG